MTWKTILKRKLVGRKLRTHIADKIDEMSEWEVTGIEPNQGKNGRIDYTDEPAEEPLEEPPHNIFPPNTPKNMDNYMRRLPAKLRQNAQNRGGFKTGQFKL